MQYVFSHAIVVVPQLNDVFVSILLQLTSDFLRIIGSIGLADILRFLLLSKQSYDCLNTFIKVSWQVEKKAMCHGML